MKKISRTYNIIDYSYKQELNCNFMKRKFLHCIFFLLSFSFCFAEDFLFNSLEGNFTNDEKDPFRYSIYKALDSNKETSFAVPFKNSSSEQFLFMIGTKKVQMSLSIGNISI